MDVATRDGTHDAFAGFDVVVNALWEGRPAVDASLGVMPPAPWSHRFRVAVFARAPRSRLRSAVLCTGPFGDIKRYADGRLYLSWYQAGLIAEGHAVEPPRDQAVVTAEREAVVKDQTLAALANYFPRVADLAGAASELEGVTDLLERGKLKMDPERHTCVWDNRPVTLTVTRKVVCKSFLGFGVEDDGWFYNEENASHGVNAEDIALREGRIAWMRPATVRMFCWYKDWNPSGDWATFTFGSPNMLSHYRTLDLYQRLGARVNITGVEWGVADPYGGDPNLFEN